jgi:competence protein ComEC
LLTLSLCLLGGALLPAFLASLPPAGCFCLALLTGSALCRHTATRPAAFALLGFGLAGLGAWHLLDERLAADRHGTRARVSARIASFPVSEGDAVRFIAELPESAGLPGRIRLTWHQPDSLPRRGESWRLTVRLRRPHGYANPGGFDYEGWLFREGIGATGYVEPDSHNYRIHGHRGPRLDRLRRRLDDRLAALFGDDESAAVQTAIVIGTRHRISQRQWELFARTGTSHLVAVSGLHIGLAAGSAFVLAWAIAAVAGGRRNLRDLALVTGLLCATGYAALSGFAVPARRAVIMAVIVVFALLRRRRIAPADVLALACIAVVLSDPTAALAPGFRLSFAAVAVLLAMAGHHVATAGPFRSASLRRLLTGVKQLATLQLSLLAGLFPLTVLEFGRFSPIAPAVNFFVVPLFNFVSVPLSLAGAILDGALAPAGDLLLGAARAGIALSLAVIGAGAAADLPGASGLSTRSLALIFLPTLFVILPGGWPGRRIWLLAVLAVASARPSTPPARCVDYHALDVGQGLAVVLQTHSRTMLFDTGPAFRGGNSAAAFTVLPFLERRGVTRLEELIVSHADLDHAGGLRDVVRTLKVGRIRAGESVPALRFARTPCVAGDRWRWDGVDFRLLHPRPGSPWHGNNASCVLEVSAGSHRLLLAGDIEAPVEKLLSHRARFRRAEIVIVPHHGSRTSSTPALVDATRPRFAIVSAGYRNRWGFPKPDVSDRWRKAGARVVNTASSGAISQRVCATTGLSALRETRVVERRFWHDPSGR